MALFVQALDSPLAVLLICFLLATSCVVPCFVQLASFRDVPYISYKPSNFIFHQYQLNLPPPHKTHYIIIECVFRK